MRIISVLLLAVGLLHIIGCAKTSTHQSSYTSFTVEDYYNNGLKAMERGSYYKAILEFDVAINLTPDDIRAYFSRGLAKINVGYTSTAISDFDAAIIHSPDDANVYFYRGILKALLGQYTSAIMDYNIAIKLNPDFMSAYYNREVAKIQLSIITEGYTRQMIISKQSASIALFDTLIQHKQDDPFAFFYRGFLKSRIGQHTAAIIDYNRAIELKPDFFLAYYRRGWVKIHLGQTSEGKQDLQNALNLAPHPEDIKWKYQIEHELSRQFPFRASNNRPHVTGRD